LRARIDVSPRGEAYGTLLVMRSALQRVQLPFEVAFFLLP
jgi:hypothetical protein